MTGMDQQKPLNPQELVDAMNRAARETREGAQRNAPEFSKELAKKGVAERARNIVSVNPDPLYEISPDGIAQMIRQPRTPEEEQAAKDIFTARGNGDMARIRQIVDTINRAPIQKTPDQIQSEYEQTLSLNRPITGGAGMRNKDAPINVSRQNTNQVYGKTDAQLMLEFRASIGRTGNEPLGMNDMRDFNTFKMNQMKGTPISQMDKNGNGSINTVQKGARVSAYGSGNTASGSGASNFSGIEK